MTLLRLCTLATIGALKHRGGRYANTVMSHIAFTAQDPRNLRATILWQKHIVYRPMAHLLEALGSYRNVGIQEIQGKGGTLYERLGEHPALEKIFQDSMQEISVQANDLLARYVDFASTRLLVDVGGGNGTNVLAVNWAGGSGLGARERSAHSQHDDHQASHGLVPFPLAAGPAPQRMRPASTRL